MNHPVHRIVQLGFLKAAKALGYTNAKVIGTEGSDSAEQFAAAEAFAAEGGKGMLLWAGDSSSYETIAKVAKEGVIVGVPHFKHVKDDGTLPEGLVFNMACNPTKYGGQVAELMAKALDGKTGSVALTQNTKNITENAAVDSFNKTWDSLKTKYKLDGITVLPAELEGGQVDSATAVNLTIIQAHSDIIGAFGTPPATAPSPGLTPPLRPARRMARYSSWAWTPPAATSIIWPRAKCRRSLRSLCTRKPTRPWNTSIRSSAAARCPYGRILTRPS